MAPLYALRRPKVWDRECHCTVSSGRVGSACCARLTGWLQHRFHFLIMMRFPFIIGVARTTGGTRAILWGFLSFFFFVSHVSHIWFLRVTPDDERQGQWRRWRVFWLSENDLVFGFGTVCLVVGQTMWACTKSCSATHAFVRALGRGSCKGCRGETCCQFCNRNVWKSDLEWSNIVHLGYCLLLCNASSKLEQNNYRFGKNSLKDSTWTLTIP